MLLKRKRPYLSFVAPREFTGPLDLRAPEDQFAANEDVEDRFRNPVVTSAITRALEEVEAARRNQDTETESRALSKIVQETVAHFRAQGVPPFAHPLLPPQIARQELDEASTLPDAQRGEVLRRFVDKFEPYAKASVAQQLRKLMRNPDRVEAAGVRPWSEAESSSSGERAKEGRVQPLSTSARFGQPATGGSGSMRSGSDEGSLRRRAERVSNGTKPGSIGPTRSYRMGNQSFEVPSGQDENDIVAGLNYIANGGDPDAPAGFANTRDGVVALDQYGRVMRRRNAPVRYSWERLRQLGALERARRGQGWPATEKGMNVRWDDKPSEEANLPPSWFAAQAKYRYGDRSDAVIDPDAWDIEEDRYEFADDAQRAASRDPDFKPTLADAIDLAAKTGRPQPIDILLVTEGVPVNARGQVMGYYGLRIRGYVVVKDGRYMIVGRAAVQDSGDFNYDLDHWKERGLLGKTLLIGTRLVPDPTTPFAVLPGFPPAVPISTPGSDFKIRANREANVRIWGKVPAR